MAVPYTFGSATTSIPLSQLDSNFATTITLGNTAIQLGNTVTTLNNMTLANVTVSSGNATVTNANVTTLTATNDASISGLTVGKGGGAVSSNTAVGASAFRDNTIGKDGVALGNLALRGNTTGVSNIAIGSLALLTNTTGSYNTAVGSGEDGFTQGALGLNSTGSYNTGVGYQALRSNTTASNNTAVGYQAGYGITTGATNVYIGYAATQSGVAVTGEIVVGANIIGKGSSTAFVGGTSGAYNGANSLNWSVTSDQRLKKNIVDNNTGLSVINQIQVRNFEYRLPEEITEVPQDQAIEKQGVQLGVIAQELQQILPECVKTESTGVMTVDADNLTWYLINAVKELSARVKQLEGN